MKNSIEDWINKVRSTISTKTNHNDRILQDLMYECPNTYSQDIADAIFLTFLTPFDSSTMQACINALSNFQLEIYTSSYIKILPHLLKTQPIWAVDLFDYPGKQLLPTEARHIADKIFKSPDGQKILIDLKSEIAHQNLDSDEPWCFITN